MLRSISYIFLPDVLSSRPLQVAVLVESGRNKIPVRLGRMSQAMLAQADQNAFGYRL